MSERDSSQGEEDIPALAEQAIRNAVASAIAAGRSVLVTQDDAVYEVFPDGAKRLLTQLLPRMRIEPGSVRNLPQ